MPTVGVAGHGELGSNWSLLGSEPDVRSILVRSEGKGLCAGGHLDLFESMLNGEGDRARVMREARQIVQSLIDCDEPIVSAINGAAVGDRRLVGQCAVSTQSCELAKQGDVVQRLFHGGGHAA